MEAATALAPLLGVDAAALVGHAVHVERSRAAAARVQAAWRGRRAQRTYLCRIFDLWILGMMRDERNPRPFSLARARALRRAVGTS